MVSIKISVLLAALVAVPATESFRTRKGLTANDLQLNDTQEARLGEFPWMVSLHHKGTFLCNSFLITPQFAMTAAQCVVVRDTTDPKLFKGYVGTINMDGPDTEITFEKIYAHPEYSSILGKNDIALLKLAQTLNLSENIQTICLPDKDFVSEDTTAQLVGWTSSRTGTGADSKLQTVTVNILENSVCDLIVTQIKITPEHICTEEKGATSIISGGPLVATNKNTPVAIGFVAFGAKKVTVFQAISMHIDWIKATMGNDADDLCLFSQTSTVIRRWGSEQQRTFYMST